MYRTILWYGTSILGVYNGTTCIVLVLYIIEVQYYLFYAIISTKIERDVLLLNLAGY
jgi:hypothetical protein